MWNSTKVKDLDQSILLRVQEEPLPEDTLPSPVKYQVDQSLVGHILVQNPERPCSGIYEGAHVKSFIATDDTFGCLVINLEEGVQATRSKTGLST